MGGGSGIAARRLHAGSARVGLLERRPLDISLAGQSFDLDAPRIPTVQSGAVIHSERHRVPALCGEGMRRLRIGQPHEWGVVAKIPGVTNDLDVVRRARRVEVTDVT